MTILKTIIDRYLPEWFGGPRLISGDSLNNLATQLFSVQDNIVAHPGGGLANATPLTATFCDVTTVASTNDSVLLPYAIPGATVTVANGGAAAVMVWCRTSNPYNNGLPDMTVSQSFNTPVANEAFATGYVTIFTCLRPGLWRRNI